MDYLPAFLALAQRPVLVVGGGEAATRKVRLLRKADAAVTLVAPEATDELAGLASEGALVWHRRHFDAADMAGKAAVFSATGDAQVDTVVSDAARARGLPVNVVDNAALSTFIIPAIVDRNPVLVAISSGGTAPVLARRIRAQVERLLPARIGTLARFAGRFRGAVKAKVPAAARLPFWERVIDGPIAEAVLTGDHRQAHERMLAAVNRPQAPEGVGTVHLVGAGPGDPDLLTLRALNLLQTADVIVHDRLIGPDILDYARRDAERIYVGKAADAHSRTQDEINTLLLTHARAGRRVVRLKGGDPFVFGRGGEERDYLTQAGIPVDVVPGITAALGCAATTGVPLTQRGEAAAVTFVTGHGAKGEPDVDWATLASPQHTLVVYMAAAAAPRIANRLIDHGLAASTPAAIIENGTRPDQRVWAGRLADLRRGTPSDVGTAGPALIVVGEVAKRAEAAADLAAQYALAG